MVLSLPSAAEPLAMSLSVAFTHPTSQRVLPLAVGAILTTGPRTIAAVLWTLGGLVRGAPSTYHRVFSRAVWYAKEELTLPDAMATVPRLLWLHTVSRRPSYHDASDKLPRRMQHLLLDQLSRAA